MAMYLASTLGAAHGQADGPAGQTAPRANADRNCVTSPACRALFEQAQQQSKSGQLADALQSYSLAYQVTPDPRLLFSLGRVRHKQGELIEAVRYYRQFLASDVDDEAQKATARSLVAQCEAALPPPQTPIKPVLDEPPAKPVVPKPPAIYQRWWFWTLLGGVAAAGIAGGIAGGVVSQQNRLPELTFRPFE